MVLLLALALIGVVLGRGLRSRTVAQGLVAAAVVLIFAIGVLVQARGLFASLYFITVAEAVSAFARPMPVVAACYALLGINMALATLAPFFWAVAGPLLGYAPGFAALAGLSLLVAEHGRGRREIATLYQRLEEAHRELERHAAHVEHLAVVRERARLAQEVHDTVAHALTGIIVQVDASRRLIREQPDRAAEALGKAEAQARVGLEEVRRTAQALRPRWCSIAPRRRRSQTPHVTGRPGAWRLPSSTPVRVWSCASPMTGGEQRPSALGSVSRASPSAPRAWADGPGSTGRPGGVSGNRVRAGRRG